MGNAAGVRKKKYLREQIAASKTGRSSCEEAPEDMWEAAASVHKDRRPPATPQQHRASASRDPATGDRAQDQRRGALKARKVSVASDDENQSTLTTACSRVQTIIQNKASECAVLWSSMDEEVAVAVQRWKSTGRWSVGEKRTQLLSDMQRAIKGKDSSQFNEAMQRAGRLDVLQVSTLRQSLNRLIEKEELEGTWRCLSTALMEADRFVLQFWLDEAKDKGLSVPAEVTAALHVFRSEGSISGSSSQAEFDVRVLEARAKGDHNLLHRLASEASRFDADPAFAEEAVMELKRREAGDVQPQAYSLDPQLAGIRCMDAQTLRGELLKNGIDLGHVSVDH
jgi:hypothetical protein